LFGELYDAVIIATKPIYGIVIKAMYIISNTKHSMLVHVAQRISLLQDAFKVGVHDKRNSFLPTVILETQPLVILAR